FNSENIYIDDISVSAEIKDWNLHIKEATQVVNGSRTRVEGTIRNLLEPRLELSLSSDKLDVGEFLAQFFPEEAVYFTGVGQCSLSIAQTFASPRVVGIMKSDSLWFHQHGIKDLQVEVNFSGRSLDFSSLSGRMNGSSIAGDGTIDFDKPEKWLDFRLHVEGDYTKYLHDWGLTSSDNCFVKSDIVVLGPWKKPVGRGEFVIQFSDIAPTQALNGSFNYSDGNVSLTAASDDEKFHLAASAKSLFHDPQFDIEANNLGKLFSLANDPKLNFIRNRYNLNLNAAGNQENLYVALDGRRRDNYEKVFRIETDTTSSVTNGRIIGAIDLFPNSAHAVAGDFELELSPEKVSLSKLYLGEWLDGHLDLSRENLVPQDGRLAIQGLNLSLILSMLGIHSNTLEGSVYGQLTVNEDESQSPKVSGNVWLLDGFFRDVGPLDGELDFVADRSGFVVNKLTVDDSGPTHISAKGRFDFSTQEINATIAGTQVKIEELIKIATGKEHLVKGKANLQIGLHGELSQIPLSGKIEVSDPQILMFDFDEAIFDFGTRRDGNDSYLSPRELMVGHALLKRSDVFTLQGPVKLPISGGSTLDVDMTGSGNFLALLPNLADVFTESRSKGHLDLRLSGKYERPNFTGSKLRFSEGQIRLTSVVDRLDDLTAELEVTEEDYFLDIKNFQGKIKKAPFTISNTRVVPSVDGREFEPLRIAGDDLNLGALVLQTSSKGVPLHIPALMEPGETGWYQFRGRTPDEPFYIAGPWLRPRVRGEVSIRNANLVFPFYEGEGEPNPIVRNIIDNIDWDVRSISENDTRYVKQFTTAIYLNMEVDPENSVLDFSGVLKDSTFGINGKVESTRGEFEYIDLNFRVEKFGAEFTKDSLYPRTYGKAWTVVRDSSNVPSDVYLTLYTVDDLNQEISKGRWDRIQIKLSSEYGGYEETQGQVMASLGYTSENVQDQARKAVGYSTDKLLFRPIMRPLERQLERSLGLDV
ncbi:hypothetical protein MJD09_05395, partial [bacterium]|nr:hypothetical protein [bacterium]